MKTSNTLTVKRIRGGSIFKFILLGSIIGFILFTTFLGIFALMGFEILKWNDEYITGIKGLIASPFLGAFLGVIFGLFNSIIIYIGLLVYSRFKDISIEYIPSNNSIRSTADLSDD